VKWSTAFLTGLFAVVLIGHHPSIHAYHTGLGGLAVSILFLVAVVGGSAAKRFQVLVALLVLAFLEPEIRIARTLQFDVVSDGLIIGVGLAWLLQDRSFPRTALPVLFVMGGVCVCAGVSRDCW